jgi:DNA-binding CsgD family transcriptional regulator
MFDAEVACSNPAMISMTVVSDPWRRDQDDPVSLDDLRFRSLHTPNARHHAAQKFSQLQTDMVATAQILAVDEVSAVMAHRLNEPLTALLIYLNEIKKGRLDRHDLGTTSDPVCEMVDNALRETERVCEILQQLGCATARPVAGESASHFAFLPKGEADADPSIAALSRNTDQFCLTPREQEVLALITGGASNKEGGYRLGISTRTFEVHRAHIMKKYGAKNAADLVRIAIGTFKA